MIRVSQRAGANTWITGPLWLVTLGWLIVIAAVVAAAEALAIVVVAVVAAMAVLAVLVHSWRFIRRMFRQGR